MPEEQAKSSKRAPDGGTGKIVPLEQNRLRFV